MNLSMLKEFCEERDLGSVVLITTFWDVENKDLAKFREAELISSPGFWGHFASLGSKILRHNNTWFSGEAGIRHLVDLRNKIVLKIQYEMVDQMKPLSQTAAGMKLLNRLSLRIKSEDLEIYLLERKLEEFLKEDPKPKAEITQQLEEEIKKLTAKNERSRQLLRAGYDMPLPADADKERKSFLLPRLESPFKMCQILLFPRS